MTTGHLAALLAVTHAAANGQDANDNQCLGVDLSSMVQFSGYPSKIRHAAVPAREVGSEPTHDLAPIDNEQEAPLLNQYQYQYQCQY